MYIFPMTLVAFQHCEEIQCVVYFVLNVCDGASLDILGDYASNAAMDRPE